MFVHYDHDVEELQEDEAEIISDVVQQMREKQAEVADQHRHAHRDAHAKSHAILKGRMRVNAHLAPELAQGIFARPGEYEVVARLSSAPGDIHSDEIPAPHGFAVKVIGVEGSRLLPELGGSNQDFLMVNFPVLAFGTVAKYKEMLGILEKNAHAPELFQRFVAAAARGVSGVVAAAGRTPGATLQGLARDKANMLGETFFTQAALRYGDYIAKISLAPTGEVTELTGEKIGDGFSAMQDAISAWFAERGATYELRAQLCTDLGKMPVEDAAVLWDEEQSPFRTIAELTFDPQDPFSPPRRVYGDDHLAFNPWDGVEEHRPLGSIMRVRKAAYESSSEQRHHLNDVPRREPASLAEIPD